MVQKIRTFQDIQGRIGTIRTNGCTRGLNTHVTGAGIMQRMYTGIITRISRTLHACALCDAATRAS